MPIEMSDAYREAQRRAAAYIQALQGARIEIMHLIGYASVPDNQLYSDAERKRMERHRQLLESLITDPAFNANLS